MTTPSDTLSLHVPDSYKDKQVMVKVYPNEKKEPEEKFRSFAISVSGTSLLIKGKAVKVCHLFTVLKKHGLSSTIPIIYDTNTMEFHSFDWNPHCYGGPKVWYFTWNNIQCSFTGQGIWLLIRVHDLTPNLGETILKEILEETLTYWVDPLPTRSISIFTTIQTITGYQWAHHSVRKCRDMGTIYIPAKIKTQLIKNLEQFYNSSDLYDKYGVTWKYVHLFYGVPGTGKTSTVLALASIFNKNIAKLTVTPDLNSQHIEALFKTVQDNTVILLEDVDALFTERKSVGSIDFSTILNCMDGLTTKRGLVLFMTTNHVTKLDEAFVRPGRVDCKIEFLPPTKEDLLEALKILAPDHPHEYELFIECNPNIGIAQLQKHLFDCIMQGRVSILTDQIN